MYLAFQAKADVHHLKLKQQGTKNDGATNVGSVVLLVS